MPAMNFPGAPTLGDIYTAASGRKWVFDGYAWGVAAPGTTANTLLNLLDTPDSFAGKAKHRIEVNPAENATIFERRRQRWSSILEGVQTTLNQVVIMIDHDEEFTLLSVANGGTTRAVSLTAALATTVYSIRRNGTEVGTITWSAGQTRAVVAIAANVVFTPGVHVLSIVGPATPDLQLANLLFTIVGVI